MITPTEISGAQAAGYDAPYALHTEPWMARGACVGRDPELWFPDRDDDGAIARGICSTCPVRQQCLDYAIADPTLSGIWGGTTERDRARVRAERRGLTESVARKICGTNSGYVRHYERGEVVCDPCREAHKRYNAELYRRMQAAKQMRDTGATAMTGVAS